MTPGKLNILVVEDNDDDLYLITSYLKDIDTFDIIIDAEINYEIGIEKIMQNKHDIYIIDYLLGPETGLELIRNCVKKGIVKPFILLTGRGDKKIDIEAAHAGAYDYLTKTDLKSEQLERSLRYSIERYSAYTAISESEHRYREIFTRSSDIIFVLNDRFQFIDFNLVMTELLGYTHAELINQPISSLFADDKEAEKFAAHIASDGINNNIEIVVRPKSGPQKTFLVSCTRISSADGNIKYQGMMYDYTNIKKTVNEQLFKEKIEATHRLVRTLAHEIRNPLTNIDLSIMQLQEELPEDKVLYADIIKRNSKRINDLLGDLMSLSKPAKNNYERIELNQIVKSALSQAHDRIKLKQIDLSEKFHPAQFFVWGDMFKMQMALLNIIINAVEAVESGTGSLEIGTVVHEGTAYNKICDNGPGIAQENLSQLFQPYFTKKKNGMGLGLATAHSVIQAHDGQIEVDSTIGKGTSFTVKLKAMSV
jgi:PAS domain S-box-containing protein